MTRLFLAIVLLGLRRGLGLGVRMMLIMLLRMLLVRLRMVLSIFRLVMVRLWQRLSVLRLMLISLPLTTRRVHRFLALILALERFLCLGRLRRPMRRGGKVVTVSLWRLCTWMQLMLDRLGLVCTLMYTGHSAYILSRCVGHEIIVFCVIRVSLSIVKLSIEIPVETAPLLAQRWMNVAKCLRRSAFYLHRGRLAQIGAVSW